MTAPNTVHCKPSSCRGNSLSYLLLVVLCLGSLTQLATAETPRFLLDRVPRLGESVKQFKHDFPAAHCRRRESGEVDAHALKREWYRWIDCAVEKGVYVKGQPVFLSMDGQLAVAMNASFQDQKLVSLSYMFGAECLDSLLSFVVLHFGPPDSPLGHLPTRSKYASWTRGNSKLEIEQLVIQARIDDSGALRIEKKSTTTGVRVRIAVSDLDPLGELQEQDNPDDSVLPH